MATLNREDPVMKITHRIYRFFLIAAFLAAPHVARAGTVTNNNGDGPGSLRQLVANATAGEIIDFAPNVTGVITINNQIQVLVPLEIQGPGPEVLTVSGGNSISPLLTILFDLDFVKVSGLSFTDSTGVAIASFSNTEIENCWINNNQGHGLELGEEALVYRSAISDNGAGGVFIQAENITILQSSITGNAIGSSDPGGGINTNDLTLNSATIEQTTISGNESFGPGGGIYFSGDTGSSLTVQNSTISGNTAVQAFSSPNEGGGGIAAFNDVSLINSTVILNQVTGIDSGDQGGGGIKVIGGDFTIKNSIVAQNFTDEGAVGQANYDCQGVLTSEGNNLIGIGNTGAGECQGVVNGIMGNQVGSPASPLDPMLGDLSDNGGEVLTHALLLGSPAIDAGSNAGCPNVDSRDTTRPLDGLGDGTALCDMGAVEAGRVDMQFNLDSLSNQKFQGINTDEPIQVMATLTNPGPDFAPGVRLMGDLPNGISLLSAMAGGQDCMLNSGQIECNLGDLDKGATVPVSLSLQVNTSQSQQVLVTAQTTGENIGNGNVLSFTLSGNGNGNGCQFHKGTQGPAGSSHILWAIFMGLLLLSGLRRWR